MSDTAIGATIGTFGAWIIMAVVGGGLYGCPQYNVWVRGKQGEAELRQAESNRQIQTLEARAKQESAKSLADAEVTRAEGVAKANQIIGHSLKDNEGYLQYLWVQSLNEGRNDVIYIPTEANVPIMEAARFAGRTTATKVAASE